MQISQTRTKAQTKSMAVYFSGLACFLLAQAWMVEAVSPFAAAYCTALFLQKRKGYMACLGTILGALVQYPALPMMTIAIPAGLFIVVGLGEIYQQATSRTLVLGTVLTAGAVSWWVFQRDTVFAMIAGGINLLLVCLFAILFEGLCRVKEDMAQKETLDDAEKLALAVLASGLLMGVGKWTFCGLNLFFCLSFTLTLYAAYYLQPSLAASFGLWTGFCGLLCGALMPIIIGGLAIGGFACAFGSRVSKRMGTLSFLLSFITLVLLMHPTQVGLLWIEVAIGTAMTFALPQKWGMKWAFRQKQKKRREEKPRLEMMQQRTSRQLNCLSEALWLTAQLMKQTNHGQASGMELQLAAQVLHDSAKQSQKGWFDAAAERKIKQGLVQKGMDITGVAVQQGKEKHVRIEVNQCAGGKGCRYTMEHLASAVCQTPMELKTRTCGGRGREKCCLQLVRKNEMDVEGGMATARKKGERVNGDVFSAIHLGKGQELICLCDGMGSGVSAAQTARIASKLIALFFEAGFDQTQVIPMVNRILSMRTKEVFAAVDLCLVDLVQGHCQMIKTGAAPSWIIRNGIAESITAPALPIGIVDEVRPGIIERTIEPGDTIVLLSDGIADLITKEELPQWLGQVEQAESAAKAAETLLTMARERAEGRDDMTAVVLRMQKR